MKNQPPSDAAKNTYVGTGGIVYKKSLSKKTIEFEGKITDLVYSLCPSCGEWKPRPKAELYLLQKQGKDSRLCSEECTIFKHFRRKK